MDQEAEVNHSPNDQFFVGSGNVFADLGLPRPEERLAKSQIASAIQEAIKSRGLTQAQAAALMSIDQPRVSKIIRGRLSEFSLEWLITRLLSLGLDVEIIVHSNAQPERKVGELRVAYAERK